MQIWFQPSEVFEGRSTIDQPSRNHFVDIADVLVVATLHL